MVTVKYVPCRGDLCWLTFDPQAGHEQKGRRPALVLSNQLFNRRVGMAMVCPITNTNRRFPFHLPLVPGTGLTGFVMVEQMKSVDFLERDAKFIGKVSSNFLMAVDEILGACMENEQQTS